MQIIPVIDLMGGQVVHARRGDRRRYAPLQSRIAPDAHPESVVKGLLALAPFERLYIADLDAIQQQGHHLDLISQLMLRFPTLEWWIDGGFQTLASVVDAALRLLASNSAFRQCSHRVRWVIGSETLSDPAILKRWPTLPGGHPRLALSLDFGPEGFRGNPALLENAASWPDHVLVMALARVGSDCGPDMEKLDRVLQIAGDRRVYAAGGVRNADDLSALARRGVAGALVATALHSGALAVDPIKTG